MERILSSLAGDPVTRFLDRRSGIIVDDEKHH